MEKPRRFRKESGLNEHLGRHESATGPLSTHTTALMANPACSVLIGEPTEKGDPLAHPRMTLICEATQTDKMVHKDRWLGAIPKAKLYYDFSDFVMFRLTPCDVHLNGGFGRAFRLKPDDLR